MTEGMLDIRGLRGQAEAEERRHGRRRIGKIVHGVSDDGHRAAQDSEHELDGAQDDVDRDADAPAQIPVGEAHLRERRLVMILDEATEESLIHPLHASARNAAYPFFTS